MASSPLLRRHDQVRDSGDEFGHGCSKSQACLYKILHIITSVSASTCLNSEIGGLNLKSEGKDSGNENTALFRGNKGIGIDLNLRLGHCLESGEESESLAESCGLSACSAVVEKVEKSSEGECDLKDREDAVQSDSSAIIANRNSEEVVIEGKGTEVSEITNLQPQSFEINNGGVFEEKESRIKDHKSEGYLGLLIKAVELIDGQFEDDEPPPPPQPESEKPNQKPGIGSEFGKTETAMRNRTKRNQRWTAEDWYGDFEDTSPVVRSKRGRSQVLPYKFRDSVLEPWKPLARPQRSTVVSTKRRSR